MTQPTSRIVAPDLLTVAAGVLACLDRYVSWEHASGASHLRELMPAFRQSVNVAIGEPRFDPTRCPYDDSKIEELACVDERIGAYVAFQCAGSLHRFRSLPSEDYEVYPDFSEVES